MEHYIQKNKMIPENILNRCMPLIVSHASRYRSHGILLEDLIQEGLIGLLKAYEMYEDGYDSKFSTYASYWIKKKILEFVDKEIKNSFHTYSYDADENRLSQKIKEQWKIEDNDTLNKDENNMIRHVLREMGRHLPEVEYRIIHLLYLDNKTIVECAKILKISREMARQIKVKALRRLRPMLKALTQN